MGFSEIQCAQTADKTLERDEALENDLARKSLPETGETAQSHLAEFGRREFFGEAGGHARASARSLLRRRFQPGR